jgi:hypothetical protein
MGDPLSFSFRRLPSQHGRAQGVGKIQYGHSSFDFPFKRWHSGFGGSLEQFEKDRGK